MSDVPAMRPEFTPESEKEQRLIVIEREAKALLPAATGMPEVSAATGYYGLPVIKEPSWSWEVPVYFFIGGAAGAAAVIAGVARLTGESPELVRDARRLAMTGSVLSPALLISDLGRPARFLAMLRVFKPQSPMSVGVWILMAFGGGTSAAILGSWLRERSGDSVFAKFLQTAGDVGALIFGLPLASYTGALIGVTVIPAWNRNAGMLPIHFAASGMAAGVGLLEMAGHRERALNWIGLGAAAVETGMGASIELERDPVVEPLKHGRSGWLIRLGGMLSGPIPLALRTISFFASKKSASKLRKYAAVSSVVGSAITRVAWIHAGHVSARESRPQ